MSSILIVDDNAANRELLCALLERAGFEPADAHDGAAALRYLETNTPDAILLDIHMPNMDGFEVLRRIREQPRFARVPIAAVSASVMTGDLERALSSGFNAFLAKPYEVHEIVALVRQLLGKA